jgi:hypothetical protein
MNKTFKGYLMVLGLSLMIVGLGYKSYADSKRATGTTTATILIDPKGDGSTYQGTAIEAVSDKLATASGGGGQVKVFSKNPYVQKLRCTYAVTTASSNIIVETTTGINVNDILYCVPQGVSYTGSPRGFVATVSVVPAGGTNLYASAVLTTNLSAGSYCYPMTVTYDAFVGSNSINRAGLLFETVPESPLRVILDSTATNDLSITVK